MKRLLKKASGFWSGPGTISQDGLNFIRQNIHGTVYNETGSDNSTQYTFMTAIYSLPFGYLTNKFGALDPAQVSEALQSYGEYFKPIILTKMAQDAPTSARGLTLAAIDIGVTLNGSEIYIKTKTKTNDTFVPRGEYVDESHW